jgi:hypothetical protein
MPRGGGLAFMFWQKKDRNYSALFVFVSRSSFTSEQK